ncbi:fused response regulator/phosphatase [Streptomyces sp. LP05-1]|uniref:Fused response regulator/phosphatase n=1 Tax=Streptomyces pyxinae TaxID=2970734 RepID=A0ABT2CBP1_9ACTN|nr:fused response regulator/phosphatase [Streptomyces sp. LP05-1]MCS0634828.1 fused response regulator/phosphatase [Streptomyces sp. LP05-1]
MNTPRATGDRPDTGAGPAALVLVVDDNPTNRYILTTCLRRAGHEVLEAEDGTRGLELLHEARTLPDAAIVDVRLPDMTGFEVCERIKGDPRTAALPVIHISASAISVTDRAQGLNRGADAYLTEPIAADELIATLTATLRYARARMRAERLAARLRLLNAATLALYSATTSTALVRAAAAGAAQIFGTGAVAGLTGPQGRIEQAYVTEDTTVAADADAAEWAAALAAYPPDVTGARLHHTATTPAAFGFGRGAGAVAVARAKRGRPPVLIAVPGGSLTPDDHDLLTQLAHACALALEALRTYSEEHTLALTLQRTFLPQSLPETDRAELAVRYSPASVTAEIGGDFYEALTTPAGLLLAVGDVAGHSLDAAVIMGQLRHALRAYAIEGHPPHEILVRLDRLLCLLKPSRAATLCILLLEQDEGSGEHGQDDSGGLVLHIANAGHLPPLVRDPGAKPRFVTEHGPLLGLGLRHPEAVRVPVRPGTDVVVVTDGLLERRGVDLQDGLDALLEAMAEAPTDPERACDHLLERFPPDGNDDVALMAIRVSGREAGHD